MDDAIATVHVTIKEWKAGSAYRGMGRRGSFLNGRRRWLVLVLWSSPSDAALTTDQHKDRRPTE